MADRPPGARDTRDVLRARGVGRSHRVGRANVGTGEHAHAWAHVLAEELAFLDEPVHVELPEVPHEAMQRLLVFLGATWEVVPVSTPTPLKARLDAERGEQAARTAKVENGTTAASGGLKAEEMNRRHQVFLDSQEMTARCSIDGCDWVFHGTAGEGRRLAVEHRAEAHPGVRTLTKAERKHREIQESRRLRAERDAAQVAERNQRALERMDAGEPQQPARGEDESPSLDGGRDPRNGREVSAGSTTGEGEPDATGNDTATSSAGDDPAAKPPHRVDVTVGAEASSPSPRKRSKHTRESIIAAIQAYAAEHGHPPAGARPPGAALSQAARYLGLKWADLVEEAGFPRPTKSTRYSKPLESADGTIGAGPSADSSGSGVVDPNVTGKTGTDGAERNAAQAAPAPVTSEPSEPPSQASRDTRAPEPPEPDVEVAAALEPALGPGGASTDLEVAAPGSYRDPIRTAETPYDAALLQDEALFLRERADALEQIADGLRKLAIPFTPAIKEAPREPA